jgi:hypothetical protein
MMTEQKIFLTYMGDITPETTNDLLRTLKKDIESFEEGAISKKKVYNVMVECLENICRHGGVIKDEEHPSILMLGKDENHYYVISGNYVQNKEKEIIKDILDEINSLDKENIQKKYRDVLMQERISEKEGAGLGIIDIALKSGNKLEYYFIPKTDQISFYILKIQVPSSPPPSSKPPEL